MCNLFSNTLPPDAMRRLFDVAPGRDGLGNQPPQPAIWPRADIAVVRLSPDDAAERELTRLHWGFLLSQVSKRTGAPIQPKAVNNARDDRLRDSPFWRDSFARRRCLIPATAWCEMDGARPPIPHWFALTGPEPRPGFAFAGVWRDWAGAYRGETVRLGLVSMVTTTPNPLTAAVHPDRMPAVLDAADHAAWLGGTPEAAFALIRPWPAERMRVAQVGGTEDAGQ